MSEINANIVVEPINLTIEQSDPGINITPTVIDLNIFTGGYACAQGNINEVQYNAGGTLAGNPALKFYPGNTTLSINGNVNAGNASITSNISAGNVSITSNISAGNASITSNISAGNANLGNAVTANYFIGDGSLLTGIDSSQISNGNSNVRVYANANIAISSAGNANIVLVTGNSFIVNGISNVGNVGNVKITGGNNGFYLQTDGTGNLTWSASGGSGNGVVGGANTQIQFNNAGNFGGAAGFTFDNTSNLFSAPGNANIVGNVNAPYFVGIHDGAVINLPYGTEKVNLIGAQTGTYNFDLITNSIQYSTSNATANLTINFRGNSTITANTLVANGRSIIGTYIMTTGATGYGIGNIQIDGAAQTIKWVNGATPTYVSNSITAYTFTLIKTATTPTYTVFGSATRYI